DQYYLRQRSYDAGIGRFTRRDTYEGRIFEPITLHKYLYANGNPVNYVDPSGFYSIAEAQVAADIASTLAGIQWESGSYLISATLRGGDYSIKDFLTDITLNGVSELVPILGLFFSLFGNGGSGNGTNDLTGNSFSSGGEQYIFRGDTRNPEDIFKNGFTAWNSNPSTNISNEALWRHVNKDPNVSPFISATTDPRVAKDFAGSGGYVYIIRRSPDSLDVNKIFPNNDYYNEHEIAIPRRIESSDILAVKKVGVSADGYTERFVGRVQINSKFRRRF
ncbi:scabin-related ADP-ribosyltransferase, partial [Laspinema olomoucense]